MTAQKVAVTGVDNTTVVVGGGAHVAVVKNQYVNAVPAAPLALIDLVEVRGVGDELPFVTELDPYRLKATPSVFGDSNTYGTDDPYVPRTYAGVDEKVRAALAGERLVLLIGPSKAGKTRTLFEAVRDELPQAQVVVPDQVSLTELAGCGQYRELAEPVVVWLENLDEFLTAERALTPRVLAALTARQARTIVVATLRREKYDELNIEGEMASGIRTVFEQACRIELESTSSSRHEQQAAKRLYPELDLTRYGVGEMLVGAPSLLAYYRRGRTPGQVSTKAAAFTAVVQVVIDWARIGRPDRIPEDRVLDLAREVVDTDYSGYDITDSELADAIDQARRPFNDAGLTTAIDPAWLIDPRIRAYRPFDYLLAADDGQQHEPRPIPDTFWMRATDGASPEILFSVANSAFFRGSHLIAYGLWQQAAGGGNRDAMFNLGVLLAQRDDCGDLAEAWYEKAAEAGHSQAMVNLGVLLKRRNELAEAETWYRKAIDVGDSGAMHNLGLLLKQRGDLAEAEDWWRNAAETRHPDAMVNLGNLAAERGDLAEAEDWWRYAAETGHPDAMVNLGILAAERGDLAEAEDWWRYAAETGHPDAIEYLGNLLAQRDDLADDEAGTGAGDTNDLES
ncbi:tetratricopeptide repeat protein [Nocardia sp. NPDC057272]|uniref:tetratricopeptide repeat protein n=1 Tax=Nocardia sp. NPDC057272 TaxID=3346079 RepID=UPI00362F13A0